MINRPGNVRIACRKDEDEIFNLLCSLYEENAMATIDKDKVWRMIHKGTRDKTAIIGVIDGLKTLAATVALLPSQWWYSSEYQLEEIWNYVTPENRKSTYAKDMIQFAKWCSEEWGIPVLMGILSNKRTEAKIGLYSRQIQHVGALFVHNLKKEIEHV